MTKSQEIWTFNKFREWHDTGLDGTVDFVDAPDVIVHTDQGRVGVELTETFIDNTKKGSSLKKEEQFHEKIGGAVVERLGTFLEPPYFQMSLLFEDAVRFPGKEKERLVKSLVVRFGNVLLNSEKQGYIVVDTPDIQGVVRGEFNFSGKLTKSVFGLRGASTPPHLTEEQLIPILENKHKALNRYERCDAYWLVIREGDFIAGSFDEIRVGALESEFDRVYLIRIGYGEVYRLV